VIIGAATLFIFANPSLTYGQSTDPTWENFPLKPLEFKNLFPKEQFGAESEGCKALESPEYRFEKFYHLFHKLGNIKDETILIKKDIINPTVFIHTSSCLDASRTQIAIYDGWALAGDIKDFSCGTTEHNIKSKGKSISNTYEESTVIGHEFSWTAGATAGVEIEAGPFTFGGEGSYSQTTTDSINKMTGRSHTAETSFQDEVGYSSTADPDTIKKITKLQKVVHVIQSAWKEGITLNPGENWNIPQVNPSIISDANLYKYSASFCKESDWVGGYPNMPSCVPNELGVEFQRIEKEYGGELSEEFPELGGGPSLGGDPSFGDDPLGGPEYTNFLQVHQKLYSDIRDFTLEKFDDGRHPGLVTSMKIPNTTEDLEFEYSLAYKSIKNPSTLIGFASVVQEIPIRHLSEFQVNREVNCGTGDILEIIGPLPKQKLKIWMAPSLGHTQVIVTSHPAPTDLRNLVVENANVIVGTYSFPLVKGQPTCFSAESRLKTDNYGAAYFVLGKQEERTCNQSGSNLIPMLGDLMITATHPDHLPTTVKLVWENELWDIVDAPGDDAPGDDPPKDDPPGNGVEIPKWVKDVAGFWCEDEIGSSEFVQVIEWMIQNGLITLPQDSSQTQSSTSSVVPDWVQFSACVWYDGTFSDKEFSTTLQWLIENGIIKI